MNLLVQPSAALVALTRTGINTFWVTMSDTPAPVRVVEMAPVLLLLTLAITMTVLAGPAMDYMQATTAALYNPASGIDAVLSTPLAVELGGTPS